MGGLKTVKNNVLVDDGIKVVDINDSYRGVYNGKNYRFLQNKRRNANE